MVGWAGNGGFLGVVRMCAVLMASALVVAGCGGDGDAAGSTEGACAFLTKDDVEKAVGGPFAAPKRNEGPSGSAVQVCSWYAKPGEEGRGFVQLTVSTFPGKGRAQFDNQRKITPRVRVIPSLGEGAFVSRFGTSTKVTALKGDRLVEVLSGDEDVATELAKAVLERV